MNDKYDIIIVVIALIVLLNVQACCPGKIPEDLPAENSIPVPELFTAQSSNTIEMGLSYHVNNGHGGMTDEFIQ